MPKDNGRIEYFLCDCGSREHLMMVELIDWVDPGFPPDQELLFSLQLNHYHPWYKRVWLGLKFMFGAKDRTWHDVTLVKKADVERLKEILDDYARRIGNDGDKKDA